MDDEPSDGLLQRARSGDARAPEALLERHEAQVYRFGLKMCRDPEDAKDLYTIARSYCSKKRRKSKYAPTEERSLDTGTDDATTPLVDPERNPEEALAGREVEHALEHAIAALEPMYREVLLLRDVEGLTAAVGIQPGALNAAGIDALVTRVRALDMDEVRRSIARQDGAASRAAGGR